MKYDLTKIEVLFILDSIATNIKHEKYNMKKLQFDSLMSILEKIINKQHSENIVEYAKGIRDEMVW